jgi:iron complex transport system substrate-binding protein
VRVRLAVLAALLASLPGVAAADAVPHRIVSLNLCTDEILLDLVPTDRIAAVSHLAADARVSPVADRAAALPVTHGDTEGALAFDPDLVLAVSWTPPATLDLLARVGRRVEKLPFSSGLDGVRVAIRRVAAAVGEVERGEALIAAFDGDLAAARPAASDTRRPSALIYQVNGLSSGPGSLADALLVAAGFTNHAAAIGIGAGGALPLETLVADPPDLLILTGPADEYRTVVAENLRHPALAALLREVPSVTIPWRLWLCESHHAGTALSRMAEARRSLIASDRGR